jgi:hypothetical protein
MLCVLWDELVCVRCCDSAVFVVWCGARCGVLCHLP